MTEPDEALLWAREYAAALCGRFDDPKGAQLYRSGEYDDLIDYTPEAFRAGQAAPTERIKALEELLNHAEDLFDWAAQSDCEDGAGSLNDAAAVTYLIDAPATKAAILEIRELTRTLLKETDQ
jgi:hypothetical protein